MELIRFYEVHPLQLHPVMKNTITLLFVLLASTLTLAAVPQTVRTSAKITEYYLKKDKSGDLKIDRTVFEIGNRFEDQKPDEKSVQTKTLTMESELTRNDQFNLVKSNAEKIGSFKIENVDESRHSEKFCMATAKDKVCHSSIDLELSVVPSLPRMTFERTASGPEIY